MKKAKVIYKDGWLLQFPKQGNAPMLFLEHLSLFVAAKCPIHWVGNNKDGYEDTMFHVRLNLDKKMIQEFASYINANL